MYINTFKYTPKDVSCQLCTEYVKKLGCTSSSQSPLSSVSADGENCDRSLAPPLPAKSATLRGPRTCCPWLAERIEAGVVGYREAVLETFPHARRMHTAKKQTADPAAFAGSAVCQCSDLPVLLFSKPFSAQDFHPLHAIPPEQLQRFRADSLTGHRNGDRRRTPHGRGAADPAQ